MFSRRIEVSILIAACFFVPAAVRGQDALRDTIDREIKAGWAKESLTPPERSSDPTFLRRVYLDLVGMIPSHDETTAFLNDIDMKKRARLIDKLLADPRFARQQADVWDLALLGRNPRNVGSPRNRESFKRWLRAQFEKNEPYDRIALKLLKAEEDGTQLFYLPIRDADEMTTGVTRAFLGIQLQCARCHDHPFEPWTQRDFYGMAGFFVRTVVVEGGGAQDKKYFVGEKSTGEVLFSGSAKDAKPGAKGAPVRPKFLGGVELDEPAMPADFKEPKLKEKEVPSRPMFSRRDKIIEWITAKENPYFAKAVVNRVWAQFMGRGFVHPVDDFNQANDPTHPQLLKAIEKGFVANKFDLKWLIREIVSSEAYQASDVGPVADALPRFYERARIRPLTVEELTASLHLATGLGVEAALKSAPSEQMLKYLGEPTDGQGRFQGSLSEHLFLHNGDQFRGMCRPNKGNLPETLLKNSESWDVKVERMFLSVLSRPATTAERERFVKYLDVDTKDAKMAAQRMEDAMWVLVSCSEFRFNR